MNTIRVGDRFRWPSSPYDITTITKIEDDNFHFKCEDGYTNVTTADAVEQWERIVDDSTSEHSKESAITPSHYNDTKIDALAVIDDWNLDFRLGNTIKYIQRHKKKGKPLEDLKKAAQYLALAIKQLEDAN